MLMPGQAVPGFEPARGLVGIAQMMTTMKLGVSRHQMFLKNFKGSDLLARSHPQREGRRWDCPIEKSGRWKLALLLTPKDDEWWF